MAAIPRTINSAVCTSFIRPNKISDKVAILRTNHLANTIAFSKAYAGTLYSHSESKCRTLRSSVTSPLSSPLHSSLSTALGLAHSATLTSTQLTPRRYSSTHHRPYSRTV